MFHFLNSTIDQSYPIKGHYNLVLVFLSILIATMASYAGLLMAERLPFMDCKKNRTRWVLFSAFVLGLGIWTTHFIGMLAFTLPVNVHYDVVRTLISILPAFVASWFALQILMATKIRFWQLIGGGLMMGTGIGVMHYLGLSAMVLDVRMYYDVKIFVFSFIVAQLLAVSSLYVKYILHQHLKSYQWCHLISASFMGGGIAGMHYTGMSAVRYFLPISDMPSAAVQSEYDFILLGLFVVFGVLIVMGLGLSAIWLADRTYPRVGKV